MFNPGIIYGLSAFSLWALFPMYWKALQHIPTIEILSHRIVWSLVFLVLLLAFRGRGSDLRAAFSSRENIFSFLLSAALIGMNWFFYIWGVNSGEVLATSMGYFITPLLNVLLGVAFLKERLRSAQVLSVILAFCGVFYLASRLGTFPWLSLGLAGSFAAYGLVRKMTKIEPLAGLTLETALLAGPCLFYLLMLGARGEASFFRFDVRSDTLLILSGVVTSIPLILFNQAARLLKLSTLGIMQYISPSGQFLLAVLLYKEVFTATHMVCFGAIWLALIIYTLDGLYYTYGGDRKSRSAV